MCFDVFESGCTCSASPCPSLSLPRFPLIPPLPSACALFLAPARSSSDPLSRFFWPSLASSHPHTRCPSPHAHNGNSQRTCWYRWWTIAGWTPRTLVCELVPRGWPRAGQLAPIYALALQLAFLRLSTSRVRACTQEIFKSIIKLKIGEDNTTNDSGEAQGTLCSKVFCTRSESLVSLASPCGWPA